MQGIKTIIVDDEENAREGIAFLLQEDTDIEIIAMCKNGIEAIDAINEFKVDLMFLDIQMPMIDGFEVLRSVAQDRLPEVIFTTAYDQFALKAFDVHAVDYLLKPFTDDRFYKSLTQAKRIIDNHHTKEEHQQLIKNITSKSAPINDSTELIAPSGDFQRLIIKEAGQVNFINIDDILWIEAYDYYVKVHLHDRFHLLRKSMKYLADILPESLFARIHKSSIVNLQHIQHIKRLGNGTYEAHLKSGEDIKVSRSYNQAIKHLIT
jgi:two-component system LytT family response regulator